MRFALCCLAIVAGLIVGIWAWLGMSVPMPQSAMAAGEKLYCVSYAPFRGLQTPLDPTTYIPAAQLEEDLVRLAKITDCVRIYSTDVGLDQVAGLAEKHGLKVLQGLWLSGDPAKNRVQVATAIDLAKRYPNTIRAVVVGNEVLLRGDMSAIDLANTIRAVKAQVPVPVTYADVWEFWLRNRDIAAAVDFITIHILPYWEDFPIPASTSGAHIETIRRQVATTFPGKEVIIGEVGWPSAGRMREAALPSPINQARVIHDVLEIARRETIKVNVIEAFDAPWKRALEGTVGGHWGLFDDASRAEKFVLGQPVSNHPQWRWQAAGGVGFAAMVFGVALWTRRFAPRRAWLGVAANALAAGATFGWAVENVPLESLGVGGWLRSLALCGVAVASPLVMSAGLAREVALPRLSRLDAGVGDRLTSAMGWILAATLVLSILIALGLVFDPRYKDFPFAPLTGAIVPLFVHAVIGPQNVGARGVAELTGAALLALGALYIVPNEMMTNWQSLWTCATFVALALTLLRVRDVRS